MLPAPRVVVSEFEVCSGSRNICAVCHIVVSLAILAVRVATLSTNAVLDSYCWCGLLLLLLLRSSSL